jgi:hypothetical protein
LEAAYCFGSWKNETILSPKEDIFVEILKLKMEMIHFISIGSEIQIWNCSVAPDADSGILSTDTAHT